MNTIAHARDLVRASFPRRPELANEELNRRRVEEALDHGDPAMLDAALLAPPRPIKKRRKKLKTFDPREILVMAGGLLMLALYGILGFFKTLKTHPLRALPVLGWGISIWFGFGAVYFCIAIIVLIFNGLGERKPGEISAYSVFNENGQRLPGTFDAEDLIGRARV